MAEIPEAGKIVYSEEEQEKQLKQLTEDFGRFVNEGKYSADEMRDAYYALCGVSENESETARVDELLSKMKEMEREGYPLNRFAELIGRKQGFEGSVKDFYTTVDSMGISEKEKSTLRSIVDKKRKGRVDFIVNGRPFGGFTIVMEDESKTSKEGIAMSVKMALERTLKSIPEKGKLEISFEED